MLSKFKLSFSFLAVCLVACQAKTSPPTSIAELEALIASDSQLCGLDVSAIPEEELSAFQSTLMAYNPIEDPLSDDQAKNIRTFLRHGALNRRLNASGDVYELADRFYTALAYTASDGDSLEDKNARLSHWHKLLTEQQAMSDADSAAFNIRFCVINEARADALADTRELIYSYLENDSLEFDETFFNIKTYDNYFDDLFWQSVIGRKMEQGGDVAPLRMARLHGPGNPVYLSDPKEAKAFWAAREAEIDAMLSHIATATYVSPAAKLADMFHIDQTMRGMFAHDDKVREHFDNAAEYEAYKEDLSTYMMKVDAANTRTLKDMLEGRAWFRDDQDGSGAARRAWLIVQHADQDHDFQVEALAKMKKGLNLPGASKPNYAYLYDRVGARFGSNDPNIKRIQRFGTQGQCNEETGSWEPFTLEEPDRVDELRADMGLEPLASYKARFNCAPNENPYK